MVPSFPTAAHCPVSAFHATDRPPLGKTLAETGFQRIPSSEYAMLLFGPSPTATHCVPSDLHATPYPLVNPENALAVQVIASLECKMHLPVTVFIPTATHVGLVD
jgi:hypothetical protein